MRRLEQLLSASAARAPNNVALYDVAGVPLSYAALDAQAESIAAGLRQAGVGPGDRVGLFLPKTKACVAAIFGVLKVGAAYVPVDVHGPLARAAFIFTDCSVAGVVVAAEGRSALHEALVAADSSWGSRVSGPQFDAGLAFEVPANEYAREPGPEGLAYILYTSGSTGVPKGVMHTHDSALSFVDWCSATVEPVDTDRFTSHAPFHFDLSIFDLYVSMKHGAAIVLFRNEEGKEPVLLAQAIEKLRISIWYSTPTILRMLVEYGGLHRVDHSSVRHVLFAGEVFPVKHLFALRETMQQPTYTNLYGPTETNACTAFQLAPFEKNAPDLPTPIGVAICDDLLKVVDSEGQTVEPGEEGELWVQGGSVMLGYWNLPQNNADVFVRDGSKPWYRTGDLVRDRGDGNLLYVGRRDRMVKRRGYRVELGEIEAALSRHESIGEVGVVSGTGADGGIEIHAHFTWAEEKPPSTIRLKNFCKEHLPPYMVPDRFISQPELPKTSSDKLDYRGLEAKSPWTCTLVAPDSERPQGAAPRTDTERSLAQLWTDLLGLQNPTAEDDFFASGGNSLSVLALVARISDTWHRTLSVRDIFDNPQLMPMAARIDRVVASQAHETLPPLVAGAGAKTEQLSYAQERILFLERMDPGSPLYSIPRALRVRGPLDASRLQNALSRIVERHEVLRTTFVDTPAGKRQRVGAPRPMALDTHDLSGLDTKAQRDRLDELTSSEACRPFDLGADLMLRGQCLRLGPDEHVVQVVFHHGFADGWSIGVFWRELQVLYSDPKAQLPDLAVQYRDYSVWQRQWLAGAKVADQLATWKRRLTPLPMPLALPTDRPRGPDIDTRGSRRYTVIPTALIERMERLAQAENSTLFMVLLAGFWSLLHRLCGQDDIVVGTPVAGRTTKELEGLIGFFVNNLALRGDLGGGPSFSALLAQARDRTLEAYDNQDVPYEKLVEHLEPERSAATPPIYQVMLALMDTPHPDPKLSGLTLSPHPVRKDAAILDLALFLEPVAEGLEIDAEYRSELFDGVTIDRLLTQYICLLEGAVANPGASILTLPVMTPTQEAQLRAWSRGPLATPDTSVLGMISENCAQDPAAEALHDHNGPVSRRALATRVEALAAQLQHLGVGSDDIVAIYLDRGIPAIVSMLAIWRVGGIYLALEPNLPPQRLALLIADAQPVVLIHAGLQPPELCDGQPRLELDAGGSAVNSPPVDPWPRPVGSEPNPRSAASLIYTSGSSGRPKGVLSSHGALLNRVQWSQDNYPLRPGERWVHKTSLAFVDSVFEIFGALALGVPLQILPPEVAGDPRRLLKVLKSSGVTRLVAVPSLLQALLSEVEATGAPAKSLWLWTSSGEPLPPPLVDRFAELLPGRKLLNIYGSTETGADATAYLVDVDNTQVPTIPIGRPLANVITEVRDAHGRLSPVGVFGELFIGGAGLALGYHRRPDLNASSFADGWFRTGDRARWRADGQLEYAGRTDRQVKLRGVRIELEAIESAMLSCSGVLEAAVGVVGEGDRRRLVGYVCPPEGIDGLSRQLATQLPALQCPQQFVGLPNLPRTPTGKLDRNALPEPLPPKAPEVTADLGEVEARLLALWRQELGVQVGPHDNFFAAGGHSLLAVRLFRRIQDEFGVDLALPLIFRAPTVATLVAHIEGALVDRPWSVIQPIRPSGDNAPLFLVHPAPGTIYCYGELAQHLGPQQPVFGIQALGLDGTPPLETVEGMARYYVRALKSEDYHPPLRLGGWSAGGVIAFEMAQQLAAAGQPVEMVVLLDAYCPADNRWRSVTRRLRRRLIALRRGQYNINAWVNKLSEDLRPVALANLRALRNYTTKPYSGRVILLQTEPDSERGRAELAEWRRVAPQVECRGVSGKHNTLLKPSSVAHTAAVMREFLA